MDKYFKINWLNVIINKEFQSYLDSDSLKEISIVSKLTREKLKPLVFKNIELNLYRIRFDSNVISIANDNRHSDPKFDYTTLRDENNSNIKDSVNDFIVALNDIKKYTKSFCYSFNKYAGYYLYSLIDLLDHLITLKIYNCKIPYRAFADIGKVLPNLIWLELECVDLIKSTTDTISEKDIIFPPSLSDLKLSSIKVITTTLLSDPYEYLFNTNVYPTSREYLALPKILIPTLKRIDFRFKIRQNRGLENFLEINPSVESLLMRDYDLNIDSSLISVKHLDIDENYSFNNIDQAFRLSNINSLTLLTINFNYSEDTIKLIQLCPNVVNLSISFHGLTPDFQVMFDSYLALTLSKLHYLKTLF
ncbi:hypothetical protein CONCODRAFT_13814 [Conidiobolus coronatus NRRL 28638]|uniref:F-box domain-containing protein n=1 Tax=Conidiobolus coronatus (strain ATCC 28846 / CBS 209.66 / NRRL 28638) TaxID=796925 RepID=A0A137NQ29_CONC2|nr:hypothetical protein CONCODRAFT_13814 [Conidiobolus coronatus NRRL 28638]|eukprot:KXN64846.1 hypothetical protein CONCODRAFT_13814 [Conidiobolus coronatus NRRL 28638]